VFLGADAEGLPLDDDLGFFPKDIIALRVSRTNNKSDKTPQTSGT